MKWCTAVVAFVLPGGDADAIAGDLCEEYALRRQSESAFAAALWYGSQLLRTLPLTIVATLARDGWRSVAVAVSTYLAAQLVEAGGTAAILRAGILGAARVMSVSVAVGLLTATLSGFVAYRVRPAALVALVGMNVATVVALMILVPTSAPLWYQLVFLIGSPLMTFGGGAIARRTHRCL
jgi:hypothetical protein